MGKKRANTKFIPDVFKGLGSVRRKDTYKSMPSNYSCFHCGRKSAHIFWGIFESNDENNAYHKDCLDIARAVRQKNLMKMYSYTSSVGSFYESTK